MPDTDPDTVTSGVQQQARNDLVMSYLAHRRAIGWLGYFLPFALIGYSLLNGSSVLSSMSAYYYSPMREIFVGTLCAQAVFLWSYEGYRAGPGQWLTDRVVARVASLGALGIALMPTAGSAKGGEATSCTVTQCVLGTDLASLIHFAAAGLFFGALAVFCLFLFVKGDEGSLEKRASNRIYRVCGWLIVASLALIGLVQLPIWQESLLAYRPVMWLEIVATFAFATSWAVKGDAIQPLVRATAQVL